MTIMGVKVQTSSATVGADSTGSEDPNSAGATTPPLRQRTAAFNGSLGFFTLGLSIEVLGEFKLQR